MSRDPRSVATVARVMARVARAVDKRLNSVICRSLARVARGQDLAHVRRRALAHPALATVSTLSSMMKRNGRQVARGWRGWRWLLITWRKHEG